MEDVSPPQRPTQSPTEPVPQRRIRSFVLRAGRITAAQQRALHESWPRYGIDLSQPSAALDLDKLFGRRAPRSLEIGFGNGDNLLGLAQANPDRDYIGVEVHRAGVGHLLLAAQDADVGNLRVICHDAVEVLEQYIAPRALDEVLILFPDPWHKKRHHKRRLIQPGFVKLLASRTTPGGHLQLATDWEPYAQQMLEVVGADSQFRNLAGETTAETAPTGHSAPTSGGFMPRPQWRALTRFERRGQRLGHGVRDLSFVRTAN